MKFSSTITKTGLQELHFEQSLDCEYLGGWSLTPGIVSIELNKWSKFDF